MRVIVAGGGIGGLAAALALSKIGIRVIVLEQAAILREVGAGLQLGPNATRLLTGWGLAEDLDRIAFEPRAAEIRDRSDGALLLDTPLAAEARARWGAPYLQAHRADLHALLLAAVHAAGGDIRPGSRVERIEPAASGVNVQVGRETLTADVLIGADGVHSRVRASLLGETPARFTGQIAWRALVPASELAEGLIAPKAIVWTAPGAHVVHYYVRAGTLVNFAGFTCANHSREESWAQAAAPGELTRIFKDWPAPVQALTQALDRLGETGWRSAVYDRPPRRRWTCGRVALLGDAAHPMPPYLAQGAGMAIEDAEAIARHLVGPLAPGAALQAYAAERFARTRRVQAWAARNEILFHSPKALRRAAFAVGRASGGVERLDWLYGYSPPDQFKAATQLEKAAP